MANSYYANKDVLDVIIILDFTLDINLVKIPQKTPHPSMKHCGHVHVPSATNTEGSSCPKDKQAASFCLSRVEVCSSLLLQEGQDLDQWRRR